MPGLSRLSIGDGGGCGRRGVSNLPSIQIIRRFSISLDMLKIHEFEKTEQYEEEITSKKGLYIFPPILSGINFAILLLVGILFMRKEMTRWDYLSVAFGGLLTVVFMVSLFLTHKIEQMRMPPKDVDKLITHGLYRIVRHPNFAGLICMNIAYLFFFRTLWLIPMICVFIVLWYYEARYEESILLSKFGCKYKKYLDITGMFFPKRNIP